MVLKLLRLLLIPLALLAVALLRLARGRIRIGILPADRLGHFAGNTEVYLCERAAGLRTTFDIWCCGDSVNEPLMRMWKRVLRIDRSGLTLLMLQVNRLFDGWKRYEIDWGNWDRDVYNLFEKYPPHLHFTAEEELQGLDGLRAMGIPEGAKWVCLIARDAAYLPELSYHSYRDVDVDTYELACYDLAERGYYVLRMGAKVAKAFGATHPRIIDYAAHHRSEFMDVYLGARCEFCISTGCGFDAIPYIFRRPICYVNYVPVEYLFTFACGSLAIWKHHEKGGKRMTLAEIYASGAGNFMRAEQFPDAGITLVDNTPAEIADVVREMCGYDSSEAHKEQTEFWSTFPRRISEHTGGPLHGEIRMRIGADFLSGYSQ